MRWYTALGESREMSVRGRVDDNNTQKFLCPGWTGKVFATVFTAQRIPSHRWMHTCKNTVMLQYTPNLL